MDELPRNAERATTKNRCGPNERRSQMTTTTAEAHPATGAAPSVTPIRGGASGAPAEKPEHTGGSTYTCPACRQVEEADA
jgi:hypothetical protein